MNSSLNPPTASAVPVSELARRVAEIAQSRIGSQRPGADEPEEREYWDMCQRVMDASASNKQVFWYPENRTDAETGASDCAELIRSWMEAVQAADAQLNNLSEITGELAYDAPLPSSIGALIEGYGSAVSRLVGDEGGWLKYFRIDCAFGFSPLCVFPEGEGSEIQITGPEAIARVICWDREHAEAAR